MLSLCCHCFLLPLQRNRIGFLTVFVYVFLLNDDVSAASIKYDQSQFGDYNVQIHLKNIELYAILDDGILSPEYDYDYTELTEKPSNYSSNQQQQQSTSNNLTSTPRPITSSFTATNVSAATTTTATINYPTTVQNQQQESYSQQTQNDSSPITTADDSASRGTKKCASGFYRDNLGRCRRIRKPHLPFLQMVHTPGVIKSFQQTADSNPKGNKRS